MRRQRLPGRLRKAHNPRGRRYLYSVSRRRITERQSESYVRSRLSLASLALAIQRATLAGTIGPECTTDRLLRLQMPVSWTDQVKGVNL